MTTTPDQPEHYRHHAHLKAGTGFYTGALTVDGEPFPYEVNALSYRFDPDSGLPKLTIDITFDSLTIEHTARSTEVEWVTIADTTNDRPVHLEDGAYVRRTYTVGQPGELIEQLIDRTDLA